MEKAPADVPVVVLEGSSRERGRIHGETMRPVIHGVIDLWKNVLSESSRLPAEEYLDSFLGSTNFMPAIDRWTPRLLDEVTGIGEGAGISFRDAYAYQLVDEQWIFTRQVREQCEVASVDHCTVMGAFDRNGKSPILVQNMDLPKLYDGTQVLLRVKNADSDVEAELLSFAGIIGTTGLNNCGVGVCCNTVSQLTSSRDGLPVAFIVRAILEQRTRADAEGFVRSIRHASGQNYTIGGPDGIVSLECSASEVVAFAPVPGRVYHTNHPVVNRDLEVHPNGREGNIPDPITGRQRTNTEQRFDAAEKALANLSTEVTVETMKEALSDVDSLVCVMRDGPLPSFTGGSIVMELSTPPVLHLAPGPPAVTEFRTYRFG